MAWIKSHQTLLGHRKTLMAAEQLGVSQYQLIGHLHALWYWGLDNADDDGRLPPISPIAIAHQAGWTKKPALFIQALISAGFIDADAAADGKSAVLWLHNWERYAGNLNAKRAKDKERQQLSRVTRRGHPADVQTVSRPLSDSQELESELDPVSNETVPPITRDDDEGLLPFEPPPEPPRERLTQVTEQDLLELQEQFPALNVRDQWARAQDWLKANGKRKKDNVAFLRNWLRRSNDDQRSKLPSARGTPGRSASERALARLGAR